MALDAVAAAPGGIGAAGTGTPGTGPGTARDTTPEAAGAGFDRALAGPKASAPVGASADPVAPPPLPEVSARPAQTGDSLGHRILDRIEAVQKADANLRATRHKEPAANEPVLKVAARVPGPAEAHPGAGASGPEIAGRVVTQPGRSQNPGFDSMIGQLHEVTGQVIQVSVVSKTTGSFTGSLNKLISSG
jgi:hypothetical protein